MARSLSPAARTESLIEALPYIQKFRGQTFVIKYGGSAMEDDQQVERLLRDVVFLEAVGINPVIVHGGGKAISSKMREAGLVPHFVNGLRVTDAASVQIVEETLDREINPGIVATIHQHGGKASGLSGKAVFVSRRLPLQRLEDGTEADIGFVGEAIDVNIAEVTAAVQQEIVPVISPIGATAEGQVLNINADVAAAALATGLKAHKLIFVSDVPGIMRNPAQADSLIPSVTVKQTQLLIKQKIIDGGMIPKVESAVRALQQGVGKIHLVGGQTPHCLLLEIFTNSGIGTEIIP
ncbi:MAG TPA: acetylglutamate kinase [Chthoniobacterales bacterium]